VSRPVCFLSDYGVADEFAGVCRAVMACLAPHVRVIDLTHGVPRQDVLAGALLLRSTLAYTPAQAVHLAVVDPGVGGGRRPLALRSADDRLFVGPDNGLLILAAEAAGGIVTAVHLTRRELWLSPLSHTFDGRDIFAPVAARLAAGLTLTDAGTAIDPAHLVRLAPPPPRPAGDGVITTVLQVDGFGNVALNLTGGGPQVPGAVLELVVAGEAAPARLGETFTSVPAGEMVVFRDSAGLIALAVNGGSAAARLGLAAGAEVLLRPWREPAGP
jgi:S-adenosylmethionine hydrolase